MTIKYKQIEIKQKEERRRGLCCLLSPSFQYYYSHFYVKHIGLFSLKIFTTIHHFLTILFFVFHSDFQRVRKISRFMPSQVTKDKNHLKFIKKSVLTNVIKQNH